MKQLVVLSVVLLLFKFYSLLPQQSKENRFDTVQNWVYRNDSLYQYVKGELKFKRMVRSNRIDSNSYKVLILRDRLYLVSHLGGEVLKELNGSLVQIDNSYEHKNQLASSIYTLNDTIFRFGGYGFFDSRNFITYYSELTNEWEVYLTNSESFPSGRFANKYFQNDEFFYLIGGSTINPNNRNHSEPETDVWRFSHSTKRWDKLGELSNFERLEYSKFDFVSNNSFVFKSAGELYEYEIIENKFYQLEGSDLLRKVFSSAVVSFTNDSIFFSVGTPNSKFQKSKIIGLSNKDLRRAHAISYHSDNRRLVFYVLLGSTLVISLVFLLVNRTRRRRRTSDLKLLGSILSYKGFKVELNELETEFIHLLIEKEVVQNGALIDLITSDLDISHKSRIKNSIIHDLNNKLAIIAAGKIRIERRASSFDKRYFEYYIKVL